jgi:hypothetical protein
MWIPQWLKMEIKLTLNAYKIKYMSWRGGINLGHSPVNWNEPREQTLRGREKVNRPQEPKSNYFLPSRRSLFQQPKSDTKLAGTLTCQKTKWIHCTFWFWIWTVGPQWRTSGPQNHCNCRPFN